jgi:hypothetical protein
MTNKRSVEVISSPPKLERKQPSVFFAILILLSASLNWLTNLFLLTNEEQEEAGVDLPAKRYK